MKTENRMIFREMERQIRNLQREDEKEQSNNKDVCENCGGILEPQDIFCITCGVKRGGSKPPIKIRKLIT